MEDDIIKIKSKSIFAVTLFLALFLCVGLVSASDLNTDVSTSSNSDDVKVVESNDIDVNVADPEDAPAGEAVEPTPAVPTSTNDDNDFTSLNRTINSGAGVINLDKDYTFNNATDSAFVKLGGIQVFKDMTIDGQGHSIDCAGQVRFLFSDGYTITLKNIKIENGYVPKYEDVSKSLGGAVFIKNADGIFEDVQFLDNYAYNRGGAVAILDGNGVFTGNTGCTFSGNTAHYGGAVDIQQGNGNFTAGSFQTNTGIDYAGAVRISQGNGSFIDVYFDRNTCNETGYGGALYFSNNANATIIGCSFTENKAKNGGAIYIMNNKRTSTLQVENTSFIDNFAEATGGAVVISNVIGQFNETVFENNSANYKGAAVNWDNSEGNFTNCNFTGNFLNDVSPFRNYTSESQKIGGAIAFSGSNADIISIDNCNFTNNNASLHHGYGGAIALLNGNLTVEDSTFEGNDVGNVVITNGLYNGKNNQVPSGEEEYQYFANLTVDSPKKITYGINDFMNITVTCMDPTVEVIGRVDIIFNNKVIATKYINNTIGEITLQNIPVGKHNLTVAFTGVPRFVYITKTIELEVEKNAVDYDFLINNITYGDDLIIQINKGTEIPNYGTVYAILGDELLIGNITDGSIRVPDVPAGHYKGYLFLDPDNFQANIREFNVIVDKKNITVTATTQDIIYGNTAVVHINVDSQIDDLAYVQIGSKKFYTKLENGIGVANLTGINAGLHTLQVYIVNPSYNANIPQINLNVSKTNTNVFIKPLASYTLNYAGTVQINVQNLSNGFVNVVLNGKKLGKFKTDAQGFVKITLSAAQLKAAGAGKKSIIVSYDGDNNHAMSVATTTLTINKEATKFANVKSVKASYKSTAKSMQLTATLKDSKNKVIKNQVVTFKVNNKKVYSVKTNAKGVATLTLNSAKIKQCKLNKKGNYKFTVTYKTTATYKQATATGKIKITK